MIEHTTVLLHKMKFHCIERIKSNAGEFSFVTAIIYFSDKAYQEINLKSFK